MTQNTTSIAGRTVLIAGLSVILPLFFTSCATTGGTTTGGGAEVSNNKAEFRSLANQIASRINRSGATVEGVNAIKGAGGGESRKLATTISYSGASISDAGVLQLAETERGSDTSSRSNGHSIRTKSERDVRFSLQKVRWVGVSEHSGLMGSSSGLKVSQSSYGRHASIKTRTAYEVSVVGDGISERWTYTIASNVSNKPTTSTERSKSVAATVATFQTRAEAVQFAKDFHRLVTMSRGGKSVELKL